MSDIKCNGVNYPLQILTGGRFSKEMIRKGENNSFVEECMYEPENEKLTIAIELLKRDLSRKPVWPWLVLIICLLFLF